MIGWYNCPVINYCLWPNKEIEVDFGQNKLLLLPTDGKYYQSIHRNSKNYDESRLIINRFLSYLSWHCNNMVWILDNMVCGSGRYFNFPKSKDDFIFINQIDHFPNKIEYNLSKEQILALALFRDAINSNNPSLSFLQYIKIINIKYKDKIINEINPLKKWLNEICIRLSTEKIIKDLKESINDEAIDIYLYKSCRCAIAHANISPIIDPDNPADNEKIINSIKVIRFLSEKIIEEEIYKNRKINEF